MVSAATARHVLARASTGRLVLRAEVVRSRAVVLARIGTGPRSWTERGRNYSSGPSTKPSGPKGWSSATWMTGAAAVTGAAVLSYLWIEGGDNKQSMASEKSPSRTHEDYQKVYNEIAAQLEEKDDYDDGSFGPVLLRLAWHASGTYDKETNTGGSDGSTMRFAPESDQGANAGLKVARDFLDPIREKFPWISYSDLWILAGVCAIQEMQGPVIPWRPGRSDRDHSFCAPDGRLPDASKGSQHLRDIFGRMGFNDQEIVALSGAHALGRCHTDRSGYTGPWTFSPTLLTNDYFRLLVEEKWQPKKWDGPVQYEDSKTKTLMMLPTDLVLVQDKAMKKYVEQYAKDNEAFFRDFSAVIVKLFELGVSFAQGPESQPMKFKPTRDL